MEEQLGKFILDLYRNGIKMDNDKLNELLEEVNQVLIHGKDKTKKEMTEELLEKYTSDVASILNDRDLIPGYSVGVHVGNTTVQVMDGYTDSNKNKKIDENTMFDIASCSKLFTQIIAYNLINDGILSFDSKVSELDPRFTNLGDLTIGDITSFNVEFRTLGRIEDASSNSQAYDILFNTEVVSKDKYNYNDIGMMILKEVMEVVTNKTYEELFNQYIVSKLDLKNTYVSVPINRYQDLTASPNSSIGLVNDPKAVILGGYSGHAGVFANNSDLLKVGSGVLENKLLPEEMVKDVYTPGINDNRRGIMGNTYIYHEEGLDKSFVSNNESRESFRVQGSTRNVFGASKYHLSNGVYVNSNSILLNPASMDLEYATTLQKEINSRALQKWVAKDPVNNDRNNFKESILIKNFAVNNQEFKLIDVRSMVSLGKTSDPITELTAELSIKLMFLDTVLKNYESEKDKQEEINIKM